MCRAQPQAAGQLMALNCLRKVKQIVGVLFFDGQDRLHQPARGDVLVAQPASDLTVRLDRDALRDEVFLDHVDQVAAGHVLGVAALDERGRD